jgi:hypothetical protein
MDYRHRRAVRLAVLAALGLALPAFAQEMAAPRVELEAAPGVGAAPAAMIGGSLPVLSATLSGPAFPGAALPVLAAPAAAPTVMPAAAPSILTSPAAAPSQTNFTAHSPAEAISNELPPARADAPPNRPTIPLTAKVNGVLSRAAQTVLQWTRGQDSAVPVAASRWSGLLGRPALSPARAGLAVGALGLLTAPGKTMAATAAAAASHPAFQTALGSFVAELAGVFGGVMAGLLVTVGILNLIERLGRTLGRDFFAAEKGRFILPIIGAVLGFQAAVLWPAIVTAVVAIGIVAFLTFMCICLAH